MAAALSRTRGAFTGVAFVSAVTNLLMLTGPLFMLQIYDRVLSSRSVPTLVAPDGAGRGALSVFWAFSKSFRARVLTRIGQRVDRELSGPAFRCGASNLPLKTRNSEAAAHPMRDLDRIRQFMAGQGPRRDLRSALAADLPRHQSFSSTPGSAGWALPAQPS